MESLLQFILVMAIVVLAAKAAGYLSVRLGQPAVLGELLIGLVLGPTLLDMLHWPFLAGEGVAESVGHVAHLGVLVLMFVAGLEVELETMREAGRPAVLAGVLGVLVPLALGFVAALPFGFDFQTALFVGLLLTATSVSISAQTLMEMGVLRSRVGMALLGAAIIDDVLVILLLSIMVAIALGGGTVLAIAWVLVRMVLYLGIALLLGRWLLPRLVRWVSPLPISEGVMALTLVVTLLYAWAAEFLGGVAAITGAFLAGLLLARTPARQKIEEGMHTLAYDCLVTVFFVSIGLEANARSLYLGGLANALALIVVAILSKVIGAGLGARVGGMSNQDALRLGTGMISRGEVGLIVATVAVDAGQVEEDTFAVVVIMVLVTTLITPLLLRLLYTRSKRADPAESESR